MHRSENDLEARLEQARESTQRLRQAIDSVIVGQRAAVDQVLWGLLAGGHVLLEGAPGLGKTLMVRALGAALSLKFSRIQFTPDLMPTDITGTRVLVTDARSSTTGRFELQRGPIFTQLLLADEINRATPKTQSALLEAMQEHAVTIAGERHLLEAPFFTLATENPIEMEGTYPLPEAQLDRFLLKVLVPSPSEDELVQIVARTTERDLALPASVMDTQEVLALRDLCRDISLAEPVARYAARLVRASAPESDSAPELVRRVIRYGAGVRGAQSLVLSAKALALLSGRPQVSFDDVQQVAPPVLRHRLIRSFEGEAEGVDTDQVITELIRTVPVRPTGVERELKGRAQ
ncbi:MAG TPA: AAA family ATPase [Polyangiaceae bacterium]|jgi:MoxR-like ATPase